MLALLALLTLSRGALGADAAISASSAPVAATQRRLPELPKARPLELPAPKPEELEEVERRLTALTDPDATTRDNAAREILETEARLVSAIRFRLGKIADSEDRDAMKRALLAVRREARDDLRDEQASEGKGKVATPDYLQMLVQHARPKDRSWVNVTRVVALSRMLERIGTVEAVRGLIDVYARYGEFLRVDTQLALTRLGERAVPALIETRRHQAEKIANWAGRELDALGKGIPSEAVQTTDHQVLADVLRAYGRIRDPDAARIIVSFAGTERSQVREAARQAIALMGETGNWQLRDAYENVVGKRAQRDWSWERTARELFAELDRLRTAEVTDLFDAGQKAQAEGDLERMRAAFDQVLAKSPLYERRDEMIGGYWEYGRRFADDRRPAAIDALRRAERLAEGTPHQAKIASLRLTLEAQERLAAGTADRALLRRALELDADNARARKLSAQFEQPDPGDGGAGQRYIAALTIGIVSVLGIAWVLLRRGAKPPAAAVPAEPEPEPKSESEPQPEPKPDPEPKIPVPVPADAPTAESSAAVADGEASTAENKESTAEKAE